MSQLSADLFPLKKKEFFFFFGCCRCLSACVGPFAGIKVPSKESRKQARKKKELTFRLPKPSTLCMAFSHDGCRENCRAYPCNVACSFVTASSQVSPKLSIRKEEKKQSGWGKDKKKKTSCLLHYTDKHLAVLFPTLYQSQLCNR